MKKFLIYFWEYVVNVENTFVSIGVLLALVMAMIALFYLWMALLVAFGVYTLAATVLIPFVISVAIVAKDYRKNR